MATPKSSHSKVNILLVDDQPARLLSYETILGELDQNLIRASSGIAALEQMMKHEFAVVLLDVSMPGMDGFETAAMIHDHPRYERTPIIFITGVHDSEFDRLKGYKLGAVDYVSIPVVPEILRSKVSVLVELHCQRKELEVLNRSLAEANAKLAKAHRELQDEKTRELEAVNAHLQRVNEELAAANQSLQTEVGERLRAETALREAARHKDEFIAILSHELRNPLAPIRNAVEIMGQIRFDSEPLAWSRDVIARQVAHLTRLIDDLLDISRITRGTIILNRAPVQVGSIVYRTLEAVQPAVAEYGHELIVNCPDEGLTIEGDFTRVVQILSNLLNNAIKYTNPGGRIELSVQRCDAGVEFRVRDNGIGFAPESVEKLFNLFSRVADAREPRHEGLGIGLALVRKLVDLHAGEVAAHSEGLNKGSEFIVRLPLLNPGAAVRKRSLPVLVSSTPDSEIENHAPQPKRILVADDNRDALESLALLLEMSGHQVWKANNGEEALAAAAAHRPDVALLDIGMPIHNGYEVAKRIRAETWGASITLVAVSGWGQTEDKRRSNEAGFDMHLVKPLNFEALTTVFVKSNDPEQAAARPLGLAR